MRSNNSPSKIKELIYLKREITAFKYILLSGSLTLNKIKIDEFECCVYIYRINRIIAQSLRNGTKKNPYILCV